MQLERYDTLERKLRTGCPLKFPSEEQKQIHKILLDKHIMRRVKHLVGCLGHFGFGRTFWKRFSVEDTVIRSVMFEAHVVLFSASCSVSEIT